MPRPITVIGAPTSAGALAPRPEEAPAALRAAGLNYKLRQAGADTKDDGDFPGFRWVELHDGPALEPERLILLGASPTRSREAEHEAIDTLDLKVIAEAGAAADPQNAAADALALIDNAPYALHFDSDCIHFADLPICENTDRNVGLPHQTAFQSLPYAAAGPGLQAIPITKIVPNHCAADGSAISTFTHGLVTALIKGWV
jgi:hypothetical protein